MLKTRWPTLPPGTAAYLMVQLWKSNPNQPLIWVTENTQTLHLAEQALRAWCPELPLHIFPDWELLPYDPFSVHPDITAERLNTLGLLQTKKPALILIALSTLQHQLLPISALGKTPMSLKVGDTLDFEAFKTHCLAHSFEVVKTVELPGQCAFRGAIIDIFFPTHPNPFRLEFFDNTIEQIRTFNPDTQRTLEKLDRIQGQQAREYLLDTESIQRFRQQWRTQFSSPAQQNPIYHAISQGQRPNIGLSYYLPLFYEQMSSFLDYLPTETNVVLPFNWHERSEQFYQLAQTRYLERQYDQVRPPLPASALFFSPAQLGEQLKSQSVGMFHPQAKDALGYESVPALHLDRQDKTLTALKTFYEQYPHYRFCFCVENQTRLHTLGTLLKTLFPQMTPVEDLTAFLNDSTLTQAITVSAFHDGCLHHDEQWVVIPESVLFGGHQSFTRTARTTRQNTIATPASQQDGFRHLGEFEVGDLVVHTDHGVGRYHGLIHLNLRGQEEALLCVIYAGDDKLYVPVTELSCLSPYMGASPESVSLHALHQERWKTAKKKALIQIEDTAAQLLNLYAKRAKRQQSALSWDDAAYSQFSNGFPFPLTIDQQTAIESVLSDLQQDKPMDRLICGDVGFGKTEVAMRATFVMASEGRQVAVLAPTTLLAQQHYDTFLERFSPFPITIGIVSRFQSSKDTANTLAQLKDGKIDIIIGTHKLLQRDVHFNQLGLVIIDEEHRFGVKQKEAMKRWKADVDVLAMTATPIPRTLHMALSNIRELSLIATPPEKRVSIKTFVQPHEDGIIQEAIRRELSRGGQVYYCHNTVASCDKTAEHIRTLVPEATVQVAHGQMSERQLESIMRDFYHQDFSVLVCTTIIETGLNIPSANTIIIDNADRFGLAQLHQLRGRVGRSHHQAYAYCLTPAERAITKDAEKRLEALSQLEALGSGFLLASQDLDIRGTGELLGENQSGKTLTAIGAHLYHQWLEEAVMTLKSEHAPTSNMRLDFQAKVRCQLPTFIPDSYLPDVSVRLTLYQRLNAAKNGAVLVDLHDEIRDRFGPIPTPLQHCFDTSALQLLCRQMGIEAIDASDSQITIRFSPTPTVDMTVLLSDLQKHPHRYRLSQGHTLIIKESTCPDRSRFEMINTHLKRFMIKDEDE